MVNILKQKLDDTSREAINWNPGFVIFTFGLMGAARGLDGGLISSTVAQKSFIAEYGLHSSKAGQAALLGNITAMVQIGGILGALM